VPTKKVHPAAAIKWRLWVDTVEKVPSLVATSNI
jgi:hypothetical protein